MPKARTQEEKERLAQAVFEAMEGGLSAFQSCKAVGFGWTAFLETMKEDAALANRYARAREVLIERLASETLALADQAPAMVTDERGVTRYDSAAVQHQRLQVDTRKWLLSKLAPKKYGERLELAGDADSPIAAAVTVSFVGAGKP
jgi:hypothetical protein